MFVLPSTQSTALPSAKKMRQQRLDQIIINNPLHIGLGRSVGMPERIFKKLNREWERYRDTSNLDEFTIEVECHESTKGFVIAFVRYHDLEAFLGFMLVNDEDEIYHEEEASNDPMPKDKKEFYEAVWKSFEPVIQMVAEKKTRPNEKCPCQSGKKWKRCCGR